MIVQATTMAQHERARHFRLAPAALGEAQCDRRARHETAEDAREEKPVFIPKHFDQQIAQEIQPGDQHDHQPDFVGIDDVYGRRPKGLIRKKWQNDHADHGKFKRRFDIAELDAPC
jgi:hypothetical protein